jgi:hypothetical protein
VGLTLTLGGIDIKETTDGREGRGRREGIKGKPKIKQVKEGKSPSSISFIKIFLDFLNLSTDNTKTIFKLLQIPNSNQQNGDPKFN